jgi:two-component system, NarL family, response regulator
MLTYKTVAPRRSESGGRAVPLQSHISAEEARIRSMLHPNGQLSRPEDTKLSSPKPDLDPTTKCLLHPEIKSARTITVLVADDHPVVREGLFVLIDRRPDMHVVAEAGNGREAMEKFFAVRPDVALLDLRMPLMDGIETVRSISERDPAAHLGIITSNQNEEDIYCAVRAGALGFILKDAAPDELARCIKAMARGETWVPPLVGAMLAKRVAYKELTRRETEVLKLVVAGKSNKEIGVALDISEATVKVHMTHILQKLEVTGRTEAINFAVKRGLVRLDMAA